MQRKFRSEFFPSALFGIALMLLPVLLETAQAGIARRGARRHASAYAQAVAQAPSKDSAETSLDLAALCEQIKKDGQNPTDKDLARCKDRLSGACQALSRLLDQDPNRKAASFWREVLKIDELKAALAEPGEPEESALQDVWNAMNADTPGADWLVFDDVRKELRRFQTVRALIKSDSYGKQLDNVCDNLSKYVDEYSKNVDPAYGTALGDVMVWLDDISVMEPRATALARKTLAPLSSVNVRLYAGSGLVTAGFRKKIEQEVQIDNNILGTRVIGSGTLSAESRAELRPSKRGAEILVRLDGHLKTTTTGYHKPVTLNTDTEGTLAGEKLIRLTPEWIAALPAKTRANLKTTIYNIRVNAGPIVQCIARNQVEERRGESQAEARRVTERQTNAQIDERIDPRIAELNENYQSKIRQTLLKTGLFPRTWDVSSSPDRIDTSLLIGNATQPAASSEPPAAQREYGLFLQLHQSALNNAAGIALSGKAFEEEKVFADLEKQFKELPKALKREEDQKPLHVTFARKGPIAISFVDNRIKAVFRIDSFFQDGSRYPGLDVTLTYNVKTVTENGKTQVVLEQAEAPQAFPRGFDPKGDQKISARHQTIRTIVLKRLETALPKKFEGKPNELKGEWEGTGALVPAFASSENGWLTLAWDWVPAN